MDLDEFFDKVHGTLEGPTAQNVQVTAHDVSDAEYPSGLVVTTQTGDWDDERWWATGVWFPQVRFVEGAEPDKIHHGVSVVLHISARGAWVDFECDGNTIQEFKIHRNDDGVYEARV